MKYKPLSEDIIIFNTYMFINNLVLTKIQDSTSRRVEW